MNFNNDNRKFFKIILLGILILILIITFLYLSVITSVEKSVTFLNIGQGDAALIEYGKKQILIDTGDGQHILSELSKTMPLFDRTIDLVIITHGDKDHVGGLQKVLSTYTIPVIVSSRNSLSGVDISSRVKVISPLPNQVITLSDTSFLKILFPDRNTDGWETNQSSIVSKLHLEGITFLFTGDSSKQIEEYLVEKLSSEELDSDVLKVGHHGSKTSSSPVFLKDVSPTYSTISAGENNRYGHPHKEVLENLKKENTTILETKNGRILFRFNGEKLEVVQK